MRSTRLAMLAEDGCAWLRPASRRPGGRGLIAPLFVGMRWHRDEGHRPRPAFAGFDPASGADRTRGMHTKGSKLAYCRVGLIGSMERAARRNIAATSLRLIGPLG